MQPFVGVTMRTLALLPLTLLVGSLTTGCSFESDALPPLVMGEQQSPRTLAAYMLDGDLDGVSKALAAGVDPNLPGPTNLPPLHLAAAMGLIEEGRMLIQQGAKIDKICVVPRPGEGDEQVWQPMTTPLHLAAQQGHVDFVLMLLEENIDVNLLNARDATPLDMANVVADQLRTRTERLDNSLDEERRLKHDRAQPLREMLIEAEDQLKRVEAVARLLEHRGAKTRLDLQANWLLAEIDADGNLHDVADRVRRWKLNHKVISQGVASQPSLPQPTTPAAIHSTTSESPPEKSAAIVNDAP